MPASPPCDVRAHRTVEMLVSTIYRRLISNAYLFGIWFTSVTGVKEPASARNRGCDARAFLVSTSLTPPYIHTQYTLSTDACEWVGGGGPASYIRTHHQYTICSEKQPSQLNTVTNINVSCYKYCYKNSTAMSSNDNNFICNVIAVHKHFLNQLHARVLCSWCLVQTL